MILCRHGRPIGTLQPLDGLVEQPLGNAHDVTGSPLLYPHQEIEKLNPVMRELLRDCLVRFDAITISKLQGDAVGCMAALKELQLRGFIRRTSRGFVLTGRGFVIREALLERAGKNDPRYA